jgi:hypothetical protein
LKKWVEAQVEVGNFVKKIGEEQDVEGQDAKRDLLFGVKCPHPECDGVMRNVNVQAAATKKKLYMR